MTSLQLGETRELAVLGCLILPLSRLPPDKSPLRKMSPSKTGSEAGKGGADFPPSWFELVCFPALCKVTAVCVCVWGGGTCVCGVWGTRALVPEANPTFATAPSLPSRPVIFRDDAPDIKITGYFYDRVHQSHYDIFWLRRNSGQPAVKTRKGSRVSQTWRQSRLPRGPRGCERLPVSFK